MSQAGKSMGASKMIFGNVKRAGADYQVTLKLLDVSKGSVSAWATETVARRKAETQAFRALAPAWLSKLTGKGESGTLQIRASVTGAAVSLDGTHVGVTGTNPVVVPDVAPGRHEVAVEKTGYTTTKQEFTLAAGQNLPLAVSLSPLSVEVGAVDPDGDDTPPVIVKRPSGAPEQETSSGGNNRTVSKVAFWVAVAGTLVSTGIGLKFANDVEQINGELDKFRRLAPGMGKCPQGTVPCNLKGEPVGPPDYPAQNSKHDQGERAQRLETVFLISAGAFAIAGGFFLYKGYLDSSGDSSSASASARGLRIFPAASASSGGIVTEFDF
jgi:hypothetical protein